MMERTFLEGLNAGLAPEVMDAILGESAREARALRFESVLEREISGARGKNSKAIAALLDLDALRDADEPEGGVREAVEALKQSDGYLFEAERPAPFAVGAGQALVRGRYSPGLSAIRAAAGLDEE